MNLTLENTFYIWGSLILAPLWVVLFFQSHYSKKKILFVSTVFGLLGMFLDRFYATKDYWHPPFILGVEFPIESFIYGFFYVGVICELFTFVFQRPKQKNSRDRIYLIPLFTSLTIASFLILVNLLKFHSIVPLTATPIIIGLIVIRLHTELLRPALSNALLAFIFTLFWQKIIFTIAPSVLENYWFLENLSGMFIWGIPLEELAFAASLGFGSSYLFEAIFYEG